MTGVPESLRQSCVRMKLILLLCLPFTALILSGQNAAPSSHLVYQDASFEGDILINEVRVPKNGEALHTYYEALGWGGRAAGYAGIQAHPKARNYIFSIWDHKEHTAPIRAVHTGPGTLTEKFGGEGTGLKSWNFELGWETDTWYTLVSRCWPVGDHTFYGFWVRSSATGEWTHLVTMDVAAKDAWFQGGNDSFIEDWLETGKNARTIHLRNGWKRRKNREWHAFGKARYSVNRWDLEEGKRSFNFRTNWDGGVSKDGTGEFYFMVSGGAETRPSTTNPSLHSIPRKETEPGFEAVRVHSANASRKPDGKIEVRWETDPESLPPFGFRITAHEESAGRERELAKLEIVEPHARRAELVLPETVDPGNLQLRLRCTDILDNLSKEHPVRLQR